MKFQTHVLFERVKAYAGFARGDFGGIIMGVGLLELWAKAGIFRVLFAGAVLALAFRGNGNGNETGKDCD